MSILAEILRVKAEEVRAARQRRPSAELERVIADLGPARGFAQAVRRPRGGPLRAIAEIKRASPSAGPIRPGADPALIAREYAASGAAAISVLTDERFFDGRLSFIEEVRGSVELPALRKDFLVDPYQLLEARAAGADAVLLIVAALDDGALAEMIDGAARLGMDALVETHDESEVARAVAAGASVIGVNHRNLATFEIDMGLTARIRPRVPDSAVLVAESGIRVSADVRALAEAGADAVLVGETLMRAESPGAALAELLEAV